MSAIEMALSDAIEMAINQEKEIRTLKKMIVFLCVFFFALFAVKKHE